MTSIAIYRMLIEQQWGACYNPVGYRNLMDILSF